MNGWTLTESNTLVYTCTNHGSVQKSWQVKDRCDTIEAPNCCPDPKPPVPADLLATFREAQRIRYQNMINGRLSPDEL
jgi:hypothetical protein